MADAISVAVVHTSPGRPAEEISVTVPAGSTVQQVVDAAVAVSGLASRFPELSFAARRLGVWGKLVDADRAVENGDRIEIYRPLNVDPKIARLRRAGKKLAGKSAKQ